LKLKSGSVDAHVGKRLRQRRIELGMSQQKLSGATQVSYQQLQKYERGFNRIGASMLWVLSGALNVEPSYFFEGLGRPGKGPPPAAAPGGQGRGRRPVGVPSDRETMELVKAYGMVADAQVRKGVRQMLGALAKSGKPFRPRRSRLSDA
jgi:transcriptional regulator with XRE-family HTH domain